MATVHILIKGKVQGVYYRAKTKELAEALDINGWVKNTKEGNVEIIATGSEDDIQQLVEWCRRGPNNAIVRSIAVTSVAEKSFPDFRIVRG